MCVIIFCKFFSQLNDLQVIIKIILQHSRIKIIYIDDVLLDMAYLNLIITQIISLKMWQIQKPDGSKHANRANNTTQTYTWKQGVVVLSDHQQLADMNACAKDAELLITTQPFYSDIHNPKIKERTIFVESSEENKSLETVDQICGKMFERGANRNSTVFIKGGGMLLDMCGFACAIYMRGVKKVVYIPTSLLAIVDATVGGKSGVNWGGAKNMLGVIKHPQEIRISLHYLQTLSDREFANGLAQVIKMALTHDVKLFQLLEKDQVDLKKLRSDKQLLREIIKRSLQIKIKVVENDQFDNDQRQWLGFGHTVGHGLQMSEAGKNLKHGQCVALGILHQIKIGQQNGQIYDRTIYKRIEKMFKKFNLPTKMPGNANITEIVHLMTKDKKNITTNNVQLTLIDGVGNRKTKTSSISIQRLSQHFNKNVCIKNKQEETKLRSMIVQANDKWQKQNRFPSSKSLTIRYLLLAALYFLKQKKPIVINNFLECQDTIYMKQALKVLGFTIVRNIANRSVQIKDYQQNNKGKFHIGNSGLTARLILPLCSHLGGQWTITCQQRMTERPNQQIFKFCKQNYDLQFDWLENLENCYPVRVRSRGPKPQLGNKPILMRSQDSSQYISSVLINSYLWKTTGNKQIEIKLQGGKVVSESYILMTIDCLKNFGSEIKYSKGNSIVLKNPTSFNVKQVTIQQDVTSLSYPYALALVHGSKLITIPSNVHQGDVQFYQYCQNLLQSKLAEQLNFAECTDTFMTMAAILATNQDNRFKINHKNIKITGISNQRVKQSNRLQLTRQNLSRIGYKVEQLENGLIFPAVPKLRQFKDGQIVVFETSGDHRLAMSMAVLSSYLSSKYKNTKFVIDDRLAVNKTFPDFWHYLSDSGVGLDYKISDSQITKIMSGYKAQAEPAPFVPISKSSASRIPRAMIIGNRGSGKTSISRMLCDRYNSLLVDLDQQITSAIRSQQHNPTPPPKPVNNIAQYVETFGWEQFRKLQHLQLQKITSPQFEPTSSNKYKNIIISLGGGIVDWAQSIQTLKNVPSIPRIYIEKQFRDLQVELNVNRPPIQNFEDVVKVRSKKYEQLADFIISIPGSAHGINLTTTSSDEQRKKQRNQYVFAKINEYVSSQYNRIMSNLADINNEYNTLHEGYIYCIPKVFNPFNPQSNAFPKAINWIEQQQQFGSFHGHNNNNDSMYRENENHTVAGAELRIDLLIKQQIQLSKELQEAVKKNGGAYDPKLEEQLIKKVRYAIAQFKIANNYIINKMPLILTLRTKQQFGQFPYYSDRNVDTSVGYFNWLRALHKISASYVDFQYRYHVKADHEGIKINPNSLVNDKKYIYSYHGGSINVIHDFLNYYNCEKHKKDIIKLYYNGPEHLWVKNHEQWKHRSSICVNMRNPITRLDNKFKLIRRIADESRLIDIPTRPDLLMLRQLRRLFR